MWLSRSEVAFNFKVATQQQTQTQRASNSRHSEVQAISDGRKHHGLICPQPRSQSGVAESKVHPEIKHKKQQFQYKLCQECGCLYLISQCTSGAIHCGVPTASWLMPWCVSSPKPAICTHLPESETLPMFQSRRKREKM
eukprot:2041530-Rhodomonas_salina.2